MKTAKNIFVLTILPFAINFANIFFFPNNYHADVYLFLNK